MNALFKEREGHKHKYVNGRQHEHVINFQKNAIALLLFKKINTRICHNAHKSKYSLFLPFQTNNVFKPIGQNIYKLTSFSSSCSVDFLGTLGIGDLMSDSFVEAQGEALGFDKSSGPGLQEVKQFFCPKLGGGGGEE